MMATTITTESQMAYLFKRVSDLEWQVNHLTAINQERKESYIELRDYADKLYSAIEDVLHGIRYGETYQEALERSWTILDKVTR